MSKHKAEKFNQYCAFLVGKYHRAIDNCTAITRTITIKKEKQLLLSPMRNVGMGQKLVNMFLCVYYR
jgi:hypothetical protein